MMFDIDLEKYAERICLISDSYELTYKQVVNLLNELGQRLENPKPLVLIKAKNNVETILGYLACLRSESAFIMLDAGIDQELEQNILDTYQPNYIWEERRATNEYLYCYNNYGLKLNNPIKLDIHPDLSLMLSTSGTTGSPKMVRLSKKNLYSNCKAIVEYLQITNDHIAITNLPLYYSFGLSVINTHLAVGAKIVVNEYSIMSKDFWNIFKENNVTTLSGVPYHYEIFRRIGLMKMDLPSLRYMTQAGGKLNHKLVSEFARFAKEKGIQFYVMYGQTEATARISYLPYQDVEGKSDSIGVVIPYGNLYIEDINTKETILEPNKSGELVYSGDNVMMGYATSLADLAKNDELWGVLHTGDIAYKDENDYFYIIGRLKRFIKIHGNRVGLDEIEHYLKSLHYDVLCTGADNKLMIATLNPNDIESIKSSVIEKYKFHHSVVKVLHVHEYPVTTAGKIKYDELIREFK